MSNLLVVSNIITAIIFFLVGYFIGTKTSGKDVFKFFIGFAVITVWIYRLVISSQNTTIVLSIWEHIMTGLVVYSLWGSKEGNQGSFIDLLLNKVVSNGKKIRI